MINDFSIAQYRFTLLPETMLKMPRFNKGNVLRGAFGSSLKRIVCVAGRDAACPACPLKEKCAYTLIFSPIGLNPAKRLYDVPRGYVLKPPLEEEIQYSPDKPFSFDMVLIGDRANYLAYVIVPFMELGKTGIGLNRGRFTLGDIGVMANGNSESIYDASSNTVRNVRKPITGQELLERAQALNQHRLTLRFLTPTRIKYNPAGERGKSEVVQVPEFHHLIRRLRDRINALSVTYCGGPITADFKGLAERAMAVKTREKNLRWIEVKRKSRTRPGEHNQSGFIGTIAFEGDLSEFLPLILLGEYVHVGEDAVFGNGWYKIIR
ncbi:MAG: CRISPR system precrRNA processing endoribonuclease RAMP protein Cas6 [Spirochaetota bacterium]